MAKQDAKKTDVARLIKPCSCTSEFQDSRYGKGQRLYKVVSRNVGMIGAMREERCTVCFKRPHRLGGHGSSTYTSGWRYAAWPAWLPWTSKTLR